MAQTVGKYMIEEKIGGSIVNRASQAGAIALDKHVPYCASRGGAIAMTKVLAAEWGRHGIRVNAPDYRTERAGPQSVGRPGGRRNAL
jgi:NAD(P)-dependent dehydrogenase (short-subunit alcohol dehydrogenase family)